MPDEKPVLAVALDFHLPGVGMNPASAQRCLTESKAVEALKALPGFAELEAAWRERERSLLASRTTETPETLAGYRRKARAYRLVRGAIEQMAANAEAAQKHLAGATPTPMPPQAVDELAALVDLLASMAGQPTLKDMEDASFAGGKAEKMVDRAQAVSQAISHPGWRALMAFLSGIAWAHWLMLGEGIGDDAEHQDTIAVIAAMIANAQNVLLQGRKAEQWFRTKAGETA